MSKSQTRIFTAFFRNSFLALFLTAGLFSAVRAEESFYYLRPGTAVLQWQKDRNPEQCAAAKAQADRLYKEMLVNPAFVSDMQGLGQYLR